MAFGQKSDSTKKRHSPRTASLLSLALPGAGQAYNKKYWKIPIALGAVGFCVWQADTLSKSYNSFRSMVKDKQAASLDPDLEDPYPDLPLTTLQGQRDIARRNRDLLIIITAGVWILNVVDASVDAHLFYYDVSDDLSLNFEPQISYLNNNHFAFLPLTLKLKLQ